jgi:hypothetical protein
VDEYFQLSASQNQRIAEVLGPGDAQGEPFPMFKPIAPDARGTCRCVDSRTRLADCVYCCSAFIISERAANVFKRANLAAGTTFLPVDVVGRDGKHLGTMVCVMFPELVLNVVYLEASKYKTFSNGRPWYFTEPPVVHGAALRGLDLLFVDWVLYVCSGRLKREVEKEELTGFAFEPMVVK